MLESNKNVVILTLLFLLNNIERWLIIADKFLFYKVGFIILSMRCKTFRMDFALTLPLHRRDIDPFLISIN